MLSQARLEEPRLRQGLSLSYRVELLFVREVPCISGLEAGDWVGMTPSAGPLAARLTALQTPARLVQGATRTPRDGRI
jgi:hypothetical protein